VSKGKKGKIPRPRGTDFLINWSLGFWSEERVLEAVNSLGHFIAFRYGVSRVGPFTFEEFRKYYERLKQAYLHGKRPDLIVFDLNLYNQLSECEKQVLKKLVDLSNAEADPVIEKALFGVEVEFSKWHVGKMLQYRQQKAQTELGPTFTIKQEDLEPLIKWARHFKKEIVVVQVFYDRAYITPFSQALSVIQNLNKGLKPPSARAERDRKTGKYTYFISCLSYGKLLGYFNPAPSIEGKVLVDERGMLWPTVELVNGRLNVTQEARDLLDKIAQRGIANPNILNAFGY